MSAALFRETSAQRSGGYKDDDTDEYIETGSPERAGRCGRRFKLETVLRMLQELLSRRGKIKKVLLFCLIILFILKVLLRKLLKIRNQLTKKTRSQ